MSLPSKLKHLAVIMDGNGRWAERHKRPRSFGHAQGAKTAGWLIRRLAGLKLPFLSLFALSAENARRRPQTEVKNLKSLLEKVFLRRAGILKEENIRLHIVGDLSVFSGALKALLRSLCEATKKNQGLRLIVALNYSGQQDIVQAVRQIALEIENRRLKPGKVDEALLSSFLSSAKFPPPDLIIRTGGQMRLSNFYLWPSAYSELYFTKTLWPDFNDSCLSEAFKSFSPEERRFGRVKSASFPLPLSRGGTAKKRRI